MPNWFCVNSAGQSAFIDTSVKKIEISGLSKALAVKSRVLVGHNLFTDLIFLYRTFIGSLPPTVTEFQEKIHALFPMVIDTKYMATRERLANSRQASSLQDLHEDLKTQLTPRIHLADDFKSYQTRHALHEAGYDSYLTAQILLKLAAKLDASLPISNPHIDTKPAENSVNIISDSVDPLSSDDDGGVALNPPPAAQHSTNRFEVLSLPIPVKKNSRQMSLLDSDIEDDLTGSPPLGEPGARDMPVNVADSGNFVPLQAGYADLYDNETSSDDFVPPFTAHFWRAYANKLRVYGTQDEVCKLDGDSPMG